MTGRMVKLLVCMLPSLAALLCAAWPASGQVAHVEFTGPERPIPAEAALSPLAGSIFSVTYLSSVDSAELHYHEYLPAGYSQSVTYPLVLLLPSLGWGADQYEQDPGWQAAANAHGYILVTVEPRLVPGYPTNYRGSFYIDGVLVPAQQDVLDALPSENARHAIDQNRLYIAGLSMGGVGALNIVSQLPGLFAAAAPGTVISDPFQQSAYSSGLPDLNKLLGGAPGDSVLTDSLIYEYGPRFLLPNLMHTPLRFVHGISDTSIPNATVVYPYMQARHIVDTPGFTDSRGRATTLQELAAAWPGAYYEEHVWPPADHNDTAGYWLPDDILGFFDAHPLVTDPLTVAFTTFDNKHMRAYWLQMNLVHPLSGVPALTYATRDPDANRITLQVTGSLTLTLDMEEMGLTGGVPITLSVAPLASRGPAGDLAVVLSGTWPAAAYLVSKDGAALQPGAHTLALSHMTLLRQATDITHTYVIAPLALTPRSYLPLAGR